jgi:hypothetical protein
MDSWLFLSFRRWVDFWELQGVRKRRRTQRGKDPPPDSDPFERLGSLRKMSTACQDQNDADQLLSQRNSAGAAWTEIKIRERHKMRLRIKIAAIFHIIGCE